MAKSIEQPISQGNQEPVIDYQRGLSQENLEDLRSEYMPIGVIVDTLPEPSEVRDWTTAGILSKDSNGVDTVSIYRMIDGKWFSIGDFQE